MIKLTYNDYKKQNDLVSSKNKGISNEDMILKYKTFSMQIECLTSLLNSSDPVKILNESNGVIIYELM